MGKAFLSLAKFQLEYKHTHKHRGTSKGADVKIINRELSYNIRIELADMESLARDINPRIILKVLECYCHGKV